MANSQDFAHVNNVIQDYFDGLYLADTSRLAKVFHPDARYVKISDTEYMNKSLSEYFAMVDRRIPPARTSDPREDRIFSIEFGGSKMAFVRASMTMMDQNYLDFLTLSHDSHGWRIMTKVFTYVPKTKEA